MTFKRVTGPYRVVVRVGSGIWPQMSDSFGSEGSHMSAILYMTAAQRSFHCDVSIRSRIP